MTTTTQTEIEVRVTRMSNSDTRVKYFSSYDAAYSYYIEKCMEQNLENLECRCGSSEPDLTAGGRGYDYRVELTDVTN